ncbi:hypothetical protein P8935_22860 [Telmatobacter sp. DSM 110680]|uniref:Uncharacterized protein n=1 Tax=Telmatobacter sp. DSM 110680 TaxID=3036704 RepID=A0AAU7DH45_9BACT
MRRTAKLGREADDRSTMQSINDLIQDYLAALRILDFEGSSVLGSDFTVAYRRLLLARIAELIDAVGHRSRAPRSES